MMNAHEDNTTKRGGAGAYHLGRAAEFSGIVEDNRVWKVASLLRMPFFVFSGPSAGGKTTTSRLVSRHVDGARLLVKHTNRPRRDDEVDGVHYHFVDDCWFAFAEQNGDLVAYEAYYGNKYGLTRKEMRNKWRPGAVFIVILNPKLALRFKEHYQMSTLFFVAPQPPEVLRERLAKRGSSMQELTLRQRYLEMELAVAEMLDCYVNTSLPASEQWATMSDAIRRHCPTIASSLHNYRAETEA